MTAAAALRLFAIMAVAVGQSVAMAAQDGYILGQGYTIGAFNVAGYGNLLLVPDEARSAAVTLEDLSLYLSGHVNEEINPFVEVELSQLNLLSAPVESGRSDQAVVIERLYNDSMLADGLTLRLGKMLSPVGEWNQIHAAPLVLAAVRPAVTFRNFSNYTTGASLIYADDLSQGPDLQVYWQPSRGLSLQPSSVETREYDRVIGGRASYAANVLDSIGLSLQNARDDTGAQQTLIGLDAHYGIDDWRFETELTYADIDRTPQLPGRTNEWGGYAALSYRLSSEWSVHGWYEAFADRASARPAQDVMLGIAWRPLDALVMRLEHVVNFGGTPVNPTAATASISVLF